MTIEQSKRDLIVEAGIQAIPYIGGPLATLYFGRKQEKRFQRLATFYSEVRIEIERIQTEIQSISAHNPTELSAILEELNDKVEAEHLETKRGYYKKYFLSTLKHPVNGNFDQRKLFLDTLVDLTPLQIELLVFFSQQERPVKLGTISKPGVEQSLILGCVGQLRNYGLVEFKLDSIVFGPGGNAINEQVALSEFGRQFHWFCLR